MVIAVPVKGTHMKFIKTIIVLVAFGAVFYFTNPDMSDFGRYYEKKQVAATQKGMTGVIGDIVKAVAQSGADLVVKVGYKRTDMLLFSVFTLGPDNKPAERYVGVLKMAFFELK
jgi:hypothetical protein